MGQKCIRQKHSKDLVYNLEMESKGRNKRNIRYKKKVDKILQHLQHYALTDVLLPNILDLHVCRELVVVIQKLLQKLCWKIHYLMREKIATEPQSSGVQTDETQMTRF